MFDEGVSGVNVPASKEMQLPKDEEVVGWFKDRRDFIYMAIEFLSEGHTDDECLEFARKTAAVTEGLLSQPSKKKRVVEAGDEANGSEIGPFAERLSKTEHDVNGLISASVSAFEDLQNGNQTFLEFVKSPRALSKLRVARDILSYHWAELVGEEERVVEVDLKEVLEDIRLCFGSEKFQIETHTTAENCQTRRGELVCLLFNLLQNAERNQRKREDKDAGVIINLVRQKKGKELLIQITDRGTGLDVGTHSDLLGKYQGRSEMDEETYRSGSGIGALNVGEIVKKRDGQVKIESRVGWGTLVKVTLPLS